MTNIIVKRGEICPTCKRYYSREMVSDGIVLKDNKILLVLRGEDPQKDYWAFPGYLNWDETIEECTIREVKEETGIDTKIVKLLGIYSNPERARDKKQNVAVIFILEPISYDLAPQTGEVKDVKWFSFDNLPEKIAFDHREIIEEHLRKI